MRVATASFLALIAVSSTSSGQTFGGPFPQIIIPDNFPGVCMPANGTAVKVVAVPAGLPAITSIRISIGINHTYYGDVNFTIDHSGTTVSLIGPVLPCAGGGDASDLLGIYTFDDAAATTLDFGAAGVAGTTIIPAGAYVGDNPLAPFLGTDPTGAWTFTLWDQSGLVVGVFFDARVNLGCNTSYGVSQNGPGGVVVIAHTCGVPGNTYVSAFEFGTAGVPNGWFYGLDINIGGLFAQIALGPPFFGALDVTGTALYFVGGVPSGLTVSSVGLQFDAATGIMSFVSAPFTFMAL